MAEWNWHIALAKDVLKDITVENSYDFLLGSVLPDIPWMTVTDSVMGGHRHRFHLSTCVTGKICEIPDVGKWISEHTIDMMYSDLYKGALTHVLLDASLNEVWNMFYCQIHRDKFRLRLDWDNDELSTKELANRKWGCISAYAAKTYGRQWDWLKDGKWISQDCTKRLIEDFGLTEHELNNLRNCIMSEINRTFDLGQTSESLIPWDIYNDIHNVVVKRAKYIIDSITMLE